MKALKAILRWMLVFLFLAGGVNHLVHPAFYVRMMPPYLPWHSELVLASGVCEIALGAFLLAPKTRTLAGWGLIALLIAVFPANLHMALHSAQFPQFALWLRLPLQGVLLAWAFWISRPDSINHLR